ncbi:MAG: hypothetical protein WD872_20685, partial [Pirellulaceae bacterium]
MYVRNFGTHALVQTPAKVNLSLEVLGKRADGFHEIETLMIAVSVYDTLTFRASDSGQIVLHSRWGAGLAAQANARRQADCDGGEEPFGDLPAGPENIVWRAADLLRRRAGTSAGAEIHLLKRIPAAAGLGGASSDAAAPVVG